MAELATDPLAVGEAALAAGDWDAARDAFAAALGQDDAPDARDGLARARGSIPRPLASRFPVQRPTG